MWGCTPFLFFLTGRDFFLDGASIEPSTFQDSCLAGGERKIEVAILACAPAKFFIP